MYVLLDKRPRCVPLWFYFFERSDSVMTILLFINLFHLKFGSDIIFSFISFMV